MYDVETCQLVLEESWAKLPKTIEHPFHPHQTLLLSRFYLSRRWCGLCQRTISNYVCYQCKGCGFCMDVDCALMKNPITSFYLFLQESWSKLPKTIEHPFHPHQTLLLSRFYRSRRWCGLCQRTISNYVCYQCKGCGFCMDVDCALMKNPITSFYLFLQESWSKLPKTIEHPFHPHQTLLLSRFYLSRRWCGLCQRTISNYVCYQCKDCGFCMDVDCALMKNPISSFYLFLHESWSKLPKTIKHPFHPHQPLLLSRFYLSRHWCGSCHRKISNYVCYQCKDCGFCMDVDCALMGPITINKGLQHIHHFSHQHPMILVEKISKFECFACQSHGLGMAYACQRCMYFLHKSCAELPQEIKKHPIHRSHPLTIRVDHVNIVCGICGNEDGFCFYCEQCKLSWCLKCKFSWQTIKYRGHSHPLTLVDGIDDDLHCSAYYTYCKESNISDDVEDTKSYWLCCLKCNFNIHLLCGPLPCTLKSKYHFHSLHLVDSFDTKDDSDDDDDDEYYCDACETKRDHAVGVYHCAMCNYVAHVRCVLPEIVNAMRGDLKYVDLRTIRKSNLAIEIEQKEGEDPIEEQYNIATAGTKDEEDMSLKDIIKKLNPDELKAWNRDFYWDVSSYYDSQDKLMDEAGDEYNSQKPFQHIDDKFVDFIYRLHYSSKKWKLQSSFMTSKVVNVKGYMVPKEMGGLLSSLLDRYEDLSRMSNSTAEMKSLCLSFLCEVMNVMLVTRVRDITRMILADWYHKLKFVRTRGFEIGFVVPLLEESMLAYFGLEISGSIARKNMIEVGRIDQKISSLRSDIDTLEAEKKKYTESCDKLGLYENSAKSQFKERCKHKASVLHWKNAAQNLN